MSRLCRLKTKTHGEDGQWAYDEITKLREQVEAQAAVIESLKRAIGAWDRAETPSELQSAEAGLLKSLSTPTDSTQILDEVRRAEREKCIYVINAQKNPITTSYANGLVFDPANNMVDKCAAAIRAME